MFWTIRWVKEDGHELAVHIFIWRIATFWRVWEAAYAQGRNPRVSISVGRR